MKNYRILLFFLALSLNAQAQSFGYEGTKNESMSKYQRIGHIEDYLKTLQSNLTKLSSEINQKMMNGDRTLLNKIEALERQMELIKSDVAALKSESEKSKQTSEGADSQSPEKKDKILDQVEENAAKIGALQASHLSLENTLKSIQELMSQKQD